MFNIFKSPIWHLIGISDWISKYVILLGLFILSIVCIAIVIYKTMLFIEQKKLMNALMRRIKQAKNLQDLATLAHEFKKCAGGKFLEHGLLQLKNIVEKKQHPTQPSDAAPRLSPKELERFELFLAQEVGNILHEEEAYLPILATSATASPLIGLFGTIWGLIHSFVSISQEKAADISVVAPGIAAALLTTLAGLVVAIPAMIAFHYFSTQLRSLDVELEHVHDLFLMLVTQQFVA
ncbi:MotA/TolQ/ExbB proton channel family protein [Candidatus Babeliales bacterium]|nr:MotA/TolQ/ExbB proton channel family protein [Candidatus Babeliales bacterium]